MAAARQQAGTFMRATTLSISAALKAVLLVPFAAASSSGAGDAGLQAGGFACLTDMCRSLHQIVQNANCQGCARLLCL